MSLQSKCCEEGRGGGKLHHPSLQYRPLSPPYPRKKGKDKMWPTRNGEINCGKQGYCGKYRATINFPVSDESFVGFGFSDGPVFGCNLV